MDPTRNPYCPGAGSPPPALFGRDAELETIRIAIERLHLGRFAKSVILTGLRGVGKTVLLQEFRRLGQSRDWVCQPLEASERDGPFQSYTPSANHRSDVRSR